MFLFRELMTNYIICVYKTSLTSPLFIEMPVPSQEIEWSCICMLLLSTLSLSMIFLLEFGPVSTEWYSFVFRFIDSFYRISIFITYLLQLLPCTLCLLWVLLYCCRVYCGYCYCVYCRYCCCVYCRYCCVYCRYCCCVYCGIVVVFTVGIVVVFTVGIVVVFTVGIVVVFTVVVFTVGIVVFTVGIVVVL